MLTILDEINGKFIPPAPLPPKSRVGKMARFGFYADSSLIWGDGGLVFDFILSKIVGTSKQSFPHKE